MDYIQPFKDAKFQIPSTNSFGDIKIKRQNQFSLFTYIQWFKDCLLKFKEIGHSCPKSRVSVRYFNVGRCKSDLPVYETTTTKPQHFSWNNFLRKIIIVTTFNRQSENCESLGNWKQFYCAEKLTF